MTYNHRNTGITFFLFVYKLRYNDMTGFIWKSMKNIKIIPIFIYGEKVNDL